MSENFDPEIIARHAAALPRYTSYPTANHFTGEVGPADYRAWLPGLDAAAPISLYLHIPFCQQLCWYCACNTKATRRYEPVTEYLALLDTEIAAVAALLHARPEIAHLHWGGGSPDILHARDILRLGDALRGRFNLRPDAEFAVEVDPRLLKAEQADSFARIGVNRVSIGVQDFDPSVQDAIGRHQGYDVTRAAIDSFRDRGVRSINVDLVYGLPRQTEDSVARTLEQVLTLAPDRIAIFGYAHLPQRMRHQQLIDQNELPGATHRFAQSNRLASILSEAGYVQLGLDHFARGDDPLARKPLARNFQGYTTDSADVLIGLGRLGHRQVAARLRAERHGDRRIRASAGTARAGDRARLGVEPRGPDQGLCDRAIDVRLHIFIRRRGHALRQCGPRFAGRSGVRHRRRSRWVHRAYPRRFPPYPARSSVRSEHLCPVRCASRPRKQAYAARALGLARFTSRAAFPLSP